MEFKYLSFLHSSSSNFKSSFPGTQFNTIIMSFVTAIRASRQALRSNIIPASTFHTSAVRSLNENDRHRDNLADHYESHKQQGLKESKEGKGKWKSELASTSEADVKADRGEFDGEHPSFEAMQEKTKHLPHEQQKANETKQ
ncbi:unnamed protein product [Penicillium salamii]|uniref:Uncharacterized protein n=1 Tax=Penicillium salamii TaxID=1612424 RepID=A0A9W4IQ43_9EURO|nr:unnamed protein product [Penicillium salamii]CAG8050293.1 unnamed protein product [Penicillium salamii]CAG8332234.1 unnamed protein product [Penicillium salamii]CAG8332487.1 unnamed protein product [Penicillium salamii]CAG8341032.1 unnamed protein product [Penicillium salamii]